MYASMPVNENLSGLTAIFSPTCLKLKKLNLKVELSRRSTKQTNFLGHFAPLVVSFHRLILPVQPYASSSIQTSWSRSYSVGWASIFLTFSGTIFQTCFQ